MVYVALDTGEPIWRYHHPTMPSDLLKYVVGEHEAIITGFSYAVANVTKRTFGTNIQKIEGDLYNLYYGYYQLDGYNLFIVVGADKQDSVKAIWSTIYKFLEENKTGFKKLIEMCGAIIDLNIVKEKFFGVSESGGETIGGERSLNKECEIISMKLVRALHEELVKKTRAFRLIAKRNILTTLIGSVAAFITFLIMFELTVYLNSIYQWLTNHQMGPLLTTIGVLDYIIPSLVLGFIVGYRKGAERAGWILGALISIFLMGYYWKNIMSWADQWNLGLYLIVAWILIVFTLGGVFSYTASKVAEKVVEERTLVPTEEEIEFGEEESVSKPVEVEESEEVLEAE